MATKIVTKNSSTASAVPTASDLVQGELAVNVADKRLFTEDNAGAIVELGTNPTTLNVNGTATMDGLVVDATSGYGSIEIGGASGAFLDLKAPSSDDYDLRLITTGTSGELLFPTGDFVFKRGAIQKLAVTSTGIDVTGTAVVDGLTSSAAITSTSNSNSLGGTTFTSAISGTTASMSGSITVSGNSNTIGGTTFSSGIDVTGNALVGRTSSLSGQSGSVSANTVLSVHGPLSSHATNAGILEYYNDETLLRSYGANAGSGKLVFKVGGGGGSADSEAMRIDSSGRVGIGMVPQTVLDLQATDNLALRFYNSTSFKAGIQVPTTAGDMIAGSAVNDLAIRSQTNMLFATGGNAERMRIDSSGNLLVGTTATDTAAVGFRYRSSLDAISSVADGGISAYFGRRTSDGDIVAFRKDDAIVGSIAVTGTNDIAIYSTTANHTGLRLGEGYYLPTNNTGGTADNAVDLGLASIRYKDLYLSGIANIGSWLRFGGASNYYVHSDNANYLRFGTAGAERARIDSAGRLLVGKGSADDSVVGLKVSSLGVITSTIASPSTNTYLMYSGGYKFYVNINGGISNFSANNVNLSDEREKKNIELLESQWDSLKQWSLKKFHYNADADSDNKKLGVIAQEVEAHNPEVIDEFNVDDDTTRMAVKEQQMMWMAIKALQEAQTRIETLEARVTELENN